MAVYGVEFVAMQMGTIAGEGYQVPHGVGVPLLTVTVR